MTLSEEARAIAWASSLLSGTCADGDALGSAGGAYRALLAQVVLALAS